MHPDLKQNVMKNYLLPNKFKKIGAGMFVPFAVLCILILFDVLDYNEATTDFLDEFAMLGLLVSLCFMSLSREKDEDEMTGLIRMRSFVWSFWATAIVLALGVVFIYGLAFLRFAFAAIFLIFVLFVVKFNAEMYKVRREGR